MEHEYGWPLVYLGAFFLAGYAAHVLGERSHVPRVTLLLLLGALGGPELLGLVPPSLSEWFPYAARLALSMVGFLLGERFVGRAWRQHGRQALALASVQAVVPAVAVWIAVWAASRDLGFALLLAGIAPTTAPAATLDVTREVRASGPLTRTMLEVVALDDAIGILLFSLLATAAGAVGSDGPSTVALVEGLGEIAGGIGVGVAFGVPMAWVTGRAKPGELTLVETLGFVLMCGGVASVLGVSYLLASIVLGAVVSNRASHHTRPFHAIKNVSQPFLVVFFLLAGFEFSPRAVANLGPVAAAYVLARTLGKLLGGQLGARWVGAEARVRRYLGLCLLPQAGVALGLGLLAARRFPLYGPQLLTLLVASTFVFELLGPVATRWALARAGEVGQESAQEDDGDSNAPDSTPISER